MIDGQGYRVDGLPFKQGPWTTYMDLQLYGPGPWNPIFLPQIKKEESTTRLLNSHVLSLHVSWCIRSSVWMGNFT